MKPMHAVSAKSRRAGPDASRLEGDYVRVRQEDIPAGASVRLPRAEALRLRALKRTQKKSATPVKMGAPAIAEASPAMAGEAFAPDARAKARLRGVKIAEEDLRRSGGAYSLEEVQALLHGVSRQSVEARVRKGSLLAVPGPSNRRYYPVVQFRDDGAAVEGLADVQAALPTKSGFVVLNFLIHPDDRLGGRKPIDLLKAGEIAPVVEAARRYGEAGA